MLLIYTGLNDFVYRGRNAFIYTGLNDFVYRGRNAFIYIHMYIQASMPLYIQAEMLLIYTLYIHCILYRLE